MELLGLLATQLDILNYFLNGGRLLSIVTIVSHKTKDHYTFKASRALSTRGVPIDLWFISVKTGPKRRDYVYFGCITKHARFRMTDGSKLSREDKRVRAFVWWWAHVCMAQRPGENPLKLVSTFTSNFCYRCGKRLTDPESIKYGLGPECRKKRRKEK